MTWDQARSLQVQWWLRSATVLPLQKGATLRRGSAWFRSRCPRVIVPSLAASLNVAIAICARSSCKVPALFCSDQQTGRSIALGRGLRLRRNACIITFWQRRSPISWRGSLGLSWPKVAATIRASSREWRKISVLGTRRGDVQGGSLTQRGMHGHLPRSASWIEEMEKRSRRRIRDLVALAASDLRPTSVFSRRNSRRHGYLQLVAKTLYTVDSFFHAPPASDSGQFHWWSDVFEPSANFIARGCRVA